MSAPGRFIAWCKQEQASLQQQLALMNQRKVLTGEDRVWLGRYDCRHNQADEGKTSAVRIAVE